ncbi:solute carrier family 22 member 4-like isoform X2 [Anabas testudineus]|uniref:solute carrier family 22 member 4-like isoform X2 n=1 Tax=Anabas testudineus TaxID=64144 RepID=UPI000E45669E|nr:solute carrier family 22 member 4-like isoform X2 [Anabas testudineus]
MQDYEELVSFLGTWGRFQRRVFLLLCLMAIPGGYYLQSVFFLLASPPHHCHIPADRNMSQDWIQASIPEQFGTSGDLNSNSTQVGVLSERSSCSRYDLDQVQNLSALGLSPEFVLSELKQEDCKDGWTYSTEYYESTVVTEFNLVCSEEWKKPLSSLAYFLGALCGSFISGQISDRFGRKPVVFGAITMLSISSIALAFAPSWPVFTLLYFLIGMGQNSSLIVLFVLGSEIQIGSTRILFSSLCLPCTWVTGMMLLPGSAYLVRNWRHLSLMMAVPGLACIPLWWQIPESPRWLISRGRLREAELLLSSAALENKVEPPHGFFLSDNVRNSNLSLFSLTQKHSSLTKVSVSPQCEKAESKKSLGFLDLLRTSNIRHTSFILWFVWFSLSLSYYGLAFNMSSLSGSPFLNYFLVAAIELPAYSVNWLVVSRCPRRYSYIGFTLMGAVALLLIQITLHSPPALSLSLVLLGKFGIMIGIGVSFVHTGELSPTVIRNTAMSSCATFSRAGCCVSPYLMQLAVFHESLPLIFAGSLSLLSIALYILLPETFRKPYPDTIQEMGQIQCFRCPWASMSCLKDDEIPIQHQIMGLETVCA